MAAREAGWYPDPHDPSRNLFWDGSAWHRNGVPTVAPEPIPAEQKTPAWVIALIGLCILLLGGLLFMVYGLVTGDDRKAPTTNIGSSPTTPSHNQSYEDDFKRVIDKCQQSIIDDFKDPDSAKFGDDWRAQVDTRPLGPDGRRQDGFLPLPGDRLFMASGSVNAKNSFGGYVGYKSYTCSAYISAEGNLYALTYPM